MTLTKQILEPDYIFTDIEMGTNTKDDALKMIANLLASQIDVSESELEDGLFEREELGTTGFIHGLAIPHAVVSTLDEPIVGIFTFKEEVQWEALDGNGVRIVFVLLTPKNTTDNEHLKLLSQLSRNLVKTEYIERILRNLSNPKVLYAMVAEVVNE